MQISTFITDDLRSRAADRQVSIDISINNQEIGSFEPDNEGMILIPASEISSAVQSNEIYQIDCYVNASFNPHQIDPANEDRRDLAIILYSISAAAPGRTTK